MGQKMNEIRFWGKADKYFALGNFYYTRMYLDGIIWKTSEHYYQAQKFTHNQEIYDQIVKCNSAMDAYKLARTYSNYVRHDWNDVKLEVMEKAVYNKFTQNNELKELLLSTGNKILIENSPYDNYWGVGGFGKPFVVGVNNWLGYILMKVRERLRE